MTDSVYQDALARAKSDLASAISRKAKAEDELEDAQKEIVQLRRTVTSLALLLGADLEDSMGLTEAVRITFKGHQGWLDLKRIQEHILSFGVSLGELKNPDASVLSVLARLVAAGELKTGIKKIKHVGTSGPQLIDQRVWKPKGAIEETASSGDGTT